jgi:hypothetical protein
MGRVKRGFTTVFIALLSFAPVFAGATAEVPGAAGLAAQGAVLEDGTRAACPDATADAGDDGGLGAAIPGACHGVEADDGDGDVDADATLPEWPYLDASPGAEACVAPGDAIEDGLGVDTGAASAPFYLYYDYYPAGGGYFACGETASGGNADMPVVPVVVNKSVVSFITYFQTSGRAVFNRWLGRTRRYMTMINAILRENGLPEDLSYIALIESGLNPMARSRANAVGMWQFMKGTGKRYGLRVDWWIDERHDPEKSTRAAARYLKDLYAQFGSWYLAAAGYNAGEGRVMRAMRKHGSEDFWVIANHKKTLKRETRDYVPKYLAAMLIAKDPALYGFSESELEYAEGLAFDRVKITYATDLRVIAGAAGTTVEEIRRLNPELLRWFTPPGYAEYEIKIPAGAAGVFHEKIADIPPPQRLEFHAHRVRRGETLYSIAKRYGTPVKPIMYLNNLKSAKRIRAGATIYVPVRAGDLRKKGGDVASDALVHWDLPG